MPRYPVFANDAFNALSVLSAGRRLRPVGKQKADEGRAEGRENDREEEATAQDFLERAAVHRDEQHRRQREGIDELIEREARSLGHQAQAPGEVAAAHQSEDRQHRREHRL